MVAPHNGRITKRLDPCGGGLEYLHRCPASRKRRQKGEPSARGYNWATLPCSWGYKYRDLALQVGGVSNETVKYGREFGGTSTQE
jgi:hypothetical protein